MGVAAGFLRLREQVDRRLLVAIILERELTGLKATPERPRLEILHGSPPGVVKWIVVNRGQTRRGLMARLAVGEYERVLAVGMLEEIVNAVFLHEPRDEVEIRLAILDAIFERGRRSARRVAEIGEAAVGEHL